MLRKIGKILKWLLILLAAVIILGIIINAVCRPGGFGGWKEHES